MTECLLNGKWAEDFEEPFPAEASLLSLSFWKGVVFTSSSKLFRVIRDFVLVNGMKHLCESTNFMRISEPCLEIWAGERYGFMCSAIKWNRKEDLESYGFDWKEKILFLRIRLIIKTLTFTYLTKKILYEKLEIFHGFDHSFVQPYHSTSSQYSHYIYSKLFFFNIYFLPK